MFKFHLKQQVKFKQNVFSNICFCVCGHLSIVKLCTASQQTLTHALFNLGGSIIRHLQKR